MQTSKFRSWGYWASTGLLALATTFSASLDLLKPPELLEGMRQLGYPEYVATLLGVWKALAVLAILAPGLPRLKEWAYAGLFFDFTGAAVSHAASGDPASKVMMPLLFLAIMLTSWALRSGARAWPLAAAETNEPPVRAPRSVSVPA